MGNKSISNNKDLIVKNLVTMALMTAVICVLAPISINISISPVPISLSTLAIYLSLIIIDYKLSLYSIILYILLGAVGLPVFSGYTGGIGKLLGPTGGYIIGYILLDVVYSFSKNIFGMILGTIALYLLGTVWLSIQMNITFVEALFLGVVPFILGDAIKIVIANILGQSIKKNLKKANLL